jgi:hypothetical protein
MYKRVGGLKQSAQQDLHSFSWGVPVEGLAGAAVELGRDLIKFDLIELGQIGASWEVLAQQPVGVFVAAALPGRVRVAEVDRDAGVFGEALVGGRVLSLGPRSRT